MEKLLHGELSEFEAERLERELEYPEASQELLVMAELRHAQLEIQAAKNPIRRAAEAWTLWFAKASLAALGRTSLALRMASAAVIGAGMGVVGYSALLQNPFTVDQPSTKAPAAALPLAEKAPASSVKKVEALPVSIQAEKVSLAVVKKGGKTKAEESEPELVVEGYAQPVAEEDLTIEVRLEHSRFVTVQIMDSNGSLSRTVHTGELPGGTWFFFLDQKDPQWRTMPAGNYAVEVNVGEQLLRKDFNVDGAHHPPSGA